MGVVCTQAVRRGTPYPFCGQEEKIYAAPRENVRR